MGLVDVLDPHPGLGRQGRGALAHLPVQLVRERRVVEDRDLVEVEIPGHARRIANRRQRASDHHPVVAGQHAGDPRIVTLGQRLAHEPPSKSDDRSKGYTTLFGSGSAGSG
jgi:hypothetical protein